MRTPRRRARSSVVLPALAVLLAVFPTSTLAAFVSTADGHTAVKATANASVAAPLPPQGYALPSGATVVTNGAELVSALSEPAQKDIVLADGVYDLSAGQHFVDANGSRLYAEHVGGAVLRAGLEVGANGSRSGAIVQGLAFDLSDPSKTFQDAAIDVWGNAGKDLEVLDCTFDGHWAVGVGVQAFQPDGLVAQRLVIEHFRDNGLRASDNVPVDYGTRTRAAGLISDIVVDGVSRDVPGSSDGRAEAGLWIGEPVAGGVHRVRVRNVALSGIETVNNAFDTVFTDLDIDMSGPRASRGVGVYLEHYSEHLVFDRFVIRGSVVGFNAEWDDGTAGNAAAHFTTIENGVVDAEGWPSGRSIGVSLDAGTESTTVRRVTFRHQSFAAIESFRTVGANSFSANTFQLATGVPSISADHT
jgi:hypothetical protein